jgi:hypothetical protein
MTATQWTSIIVALAFALPLAFALLEDLDLNFKLKSMIVVKFPDEIEHQFYQLDYYISRCSYAVMWTIRNPEVSDLFIFPLLHINLKDVKLEA